MAEVASPEGSLLIPYEIRRNARSRYIRLTLGDAGQARLSIPAHCSQAEAVSFLRTQGEWLHTQLQKTPPRVLLRSHLETHPHVYALGHSLCLKIGYTRGRSYYLYSLQPPEALFQLHSGTDKELVREGWGGGTAKHANVNGKRADTHSDAEAQLRTQLRAFAQEVLPLRTQALAQAHHIRYKRVTVRDQSSRWGSCSTNGTLSLNWRLILLRPPLQDHVILHELAHLREMNHSERFWELLRSYDAHCDAHNRQLNVVASKIMPL